MPNIALISQLTMINEICGMQIADCGHDVEVFDSTHDFLVSQKQVSKTNNIDAIVINVLSRADVDQINILREAKETKGRFATTPIIAASDCAKFSDDVIKAGAIFVKLSGTSFDKKVPAALNRIFPCTPNKFGKLAKFHAPKPC